MKPIIPGIARAAAPHMVAVMCSETAAVASTP